MFPTGGRMYIGDESRRGRIMEEQADTVSSLYLRKAERTQKGHIKGRNHKLKRKGYLNPGISSVELLDPHLDLSDLVR